MEIDSINPFSATGLFLYPLSSFATMNKYLSPGTFLNFEYMWYRKKCHVTVSFYNPWKYQKTRCFQFSGSIERDQWHEQGYWNSNQIKFEVISNRCSHWRKNVITKSKFILTLWLFWYLVNIFAHVCKIWSNIIEDNELLKKWSFHYGFLH